MPEQDIHIFNKNIDTRKILSELAGSGGSTNYGINHFIIIKESDGIFNVYIRIHQVEKLVGEDIMDIKSNIYNNLKDCYHIIYKRNNKITKSSSATDNIIVIFSILNKGVDTINIEKLEKYEKYEDDKMYVTLYTKLIDELPKLF
jgi:hypothetical protein